jgi:hypothetical protein
MFSYFPSEIELKFPSTWIKDASWKQWIDIVIKPNKALCCAPALGVGMFTKSCHSGQEGMKHAAALAFIVKFLNFPQNVGLFMDNLGNNWQEPYG